MPCLHKRLRSIGVIQYAPAPGDLHRITLGVSCEECGVEFRFVTGDGGTAYNDQATLLTAWLGEPAPSAPNPAK